MTALLEGVRCYVDAQKTAPTWTLSCIPEFRTLDAAAPLARKGFGTPELLGQILTWTSIPTVLDCLGVDKNFSTPFEARLSSSADLA